MKPQLFLLVPLWFALPLGAQTFGPQVTADSTARAIPGTVPTESGDAAQLTAQQLDQLLGPIALYPDALIALILPSATVSSDVVLAARYLAGEGSAAPEFENQAWDDSVKALAHYPSVLQWMDQNLAWTKQLGDAFLQQPAEVMKSIQRLRAAARAAGTLFDTPQQQIVADAETITIVPAQPDVIYVPYYNPQSVYLPRSAYDYYPGASFFSFSVGYPVGFWLGYQLDWRQRRVWVIDRYQRERYWREQHDWRQSSYSVGVTWTQDSVRRPWAPDPSRIRPVPPQFHRGSVAVVRPAPVARETIAPAISSRWTESERAERAVRGSTVQTPQPSAADRERGERPRRPNVTPSPALPTNPPAVVSTPPSPAMPVVAPSAPVSNVSPPPTVYNRGSRNTATFAPSQNRAANVAPQPAASPVAPTQTRVRRELAPAPAAPVPTRAFVPPTPAAAPPPPVASPSPSTQPRAAAPAQPTAQKATASPSGRSTPQSYSRGSEHQERDSRDERQ